MGCFSKAVVPSGERRPDSLRHEDLLSHITFSGHPEFDSYLLAFPSSQVFKISPLVVHRYTGPDVGLKAIGNGFFPTMRKLFGASTSKIWPRSAAFCSWKGTTSACCAVATCASSNNKT